jgi:hypothetical protein
MYRPFAFGFVLVSLAASTLLDTKTLSAQEWAQKLFAEKVHDFGSVAKGAKAEYVFPITNNLIPDVHIASVRTSCGCTTPTIAGDKSTLKTYEQGGILAHLNSDTHIGQRAATLTVTFDRPAWAEVQLQIRALVHTDVMMEPSSVQFGTVEQGKPAETKVRLYRADYPGWQLGDVRFSDPHLQGEIVQVARQGSQTWYDLKVRLDPKTPAGYVTDHAILTTNDPVMAQMPIQVEGQVRPSVSVSPSNLFLGVVQAGDKVTRKFVVRGDKPFRIKSITGDKGAFEIPAPPTEAKDVYVLPVTFVASPTETGKVVKTIHIETDQGETNATTYAVVNDKAPEKVPEKLSENK